MSSSVAPKGFTPAELLIALAILGVIATFTIPKVLQVQGDKQNLAITKEAAGAVSEAFLAYKARYTVTGNFWFYDMTPFLNYVRVPNGTVIDDSPTGTLTCQPGDPCLKLHNGAILMHDEDRIGGTAATNALYFAIDPDGKTSSVKTVYFVLYANGKLRTWGTMDPNTQTQSNTYNPNPSVDPSWFSW